MDEQIEVMRKQRDNAIAADAMQVRHTVEMQAQRDALLEALTIALPVLVAAWQCDSSLERSKAAGNAMRKANAAIAKATNNETQTHKD